ncbi:MAG: M20/M25/M40 family metallo-hydrolase [Elusimicrobia bacterium]|nr:M20/M25/M40 family metallo-hydrolase [Elusimicrobiota bacterium]
MKPGALPLFQHLTSVPTAPFHERAVAGKAREWIARHLGRRVTVRDVRGGIIVTYRGAGDGPALALAAHLDHPAFRLEKVTADGALGLLQGGLPPHLLAGAAVEAFPAVPKNNIPAARGILGPRPKKDGGLWTIRWFEAPPRGVKPVFAVLALHACDITDGWLNSRSVDDLLGCSVSLEAVRRLANAKVKTNVTVLLNRAEEVGFVGALDMIRSGVLSPDDSYLSIESSRELPGSKPGQGPTIRLGDKACAFDPNLVALLDDAAARLRRRGTKVQRRRLTGGTCEATAYLTFGLEAAGVAVPLVNYHNGWGADAVAPERVRTSDVEGAVRLLVEAAKLFPAQTLRGALRARLTRRHLASAKSLGKGNLAQSRR